MATHRLQASVWLGVNGEPLTACRCYLVPHSHDVTEQSAFNEVAFGVVMTLDIPNELVPHWLTWPCE